MLSPLLISLSIWSPFISIGSTILQPLYWVVSGVLVLFHSVWSPVFGAGNGWTWALSIVSLTVVIRVALIPLFVKQIKSSRSMQLLQPKVRELQKKYGHDREKLGAETMKLYKENNANPLASCLPLLIQMPIFLALFRVLNGAATGVARGHWLTIHPELRRLARGLDDLRCADLRHLHQGRLRQRHHQRPPADAGLIIAMTVTLFITQLQLMRKNMPMEALEGPFAQQQKIMLYVFPLIFAVGGINFPVGVLIYWFTSNLWTMGQQFYVIRRNPAPGTPAFAAWEERRQRHESHRPVAEPLAETGRGSVAVAEAARNGSTASAASAAPRVVRQQPRKATRSQRRP